MTETKGAHPQSIQALGVLVTMKNLLAALALFSTAVSAQVPIYWGCQNEIAKSFDYCNPELSIDERLDDLIANLTIEEKISLISPQPELGSLCAAHTGSIERKGFPSHMWLVEVNNGVSSACILGKCSTQFAGPLSMAASFNKTSWYWKGRVIGTEQRAWVNLQNTRNIHHKDKEWLGITAFGPNICQPRDPRNGRTSELPGEDPFLSGTYGAHFVRGLQHRDSNGYPLTLAYLKTFAAYSKESNRFHDTHDISLFDLHDTYLAQYEIAIQNATGLMCSYSGINGAPSCSNDYLLNRVLRDRWKRPDAHVTSDCGAIKNLLGPPANLTNAPTAAAWSIMNGTDLEMGSTIWTDCLMEAVMNETVPEERLDEAIRRGYRPHFVAGRFDDLKASEWGALGWDNIRAPIHEQIGLEAALQGLVLLKHNSSVLPLAVNKTAVAVLGPLAHTRAGLMSDYENDENCPWEGFHGHGCIPTLAESISSIHPSATSSIGVDIDSNRTDGIEHALMLASKADVVVLCLGITKVQEHEEKDRTDIALPGLQPEFARQVLAIGTPVILILVHGGQVAIEEFVEPVSAIIDAFNPNNIGGHALALSLFGLENRWGKLPYTVYPYDDVMQSFNMDDYSITKSPGRTHRYYTGTPIFPFGYGLSYTTFSISCTFPGFSEHEIVVACHTKNLGKLLGDEVIQVYHSAGQDIRDTVGHPVPLKTLVAFERVTVKPGEIQTTRIKLDKRAAFALTNLRGDKVVYAGSHILTVTNGVEVSSLQTLMVDETTNVL